MKFTLAVLALAVLASSLPAQTTDSGQRPTYPTYPTGRPLTTYSYREARTIYIENHTSQASSVDVAFDELKNWGHFKIVGQPNDADLIFQLGDAYLAVFSQRWGSNSNCLPAGRGGAQANYFWGTSLSSMGKNSGGVKGMVEDFIRSWEIESATEDQMLKRRRLPLNSLQAKKVFIDNHTGKAALTEAASDEFKEWGFFDVVHDRDNADLIFAVDYHGQFIGDLSWADDICGIVRLLARQGEGVTGLVRRLRERVEGIDSPSYNPYGVPYVVPIPPAHPAPPAVDRTK